MDMHRMILITGGMKDHMLTEKAVAYTYSLKQVIFANIHRMEEKLFQGGDMDARINCLQAELEDVMKIRKRESAVTGPPMRTSKGTSARSAYINM